jgi:spore coat protein U-like protein
MSSSSSNHAFQGVISMKWSKTILSTLSIAVIGFLALGITSTPAFAAGNATANLSIGASVTATCIVSTTALSFGSYTGATAINTTGTILVTCTNSTTYNVGLNAGSASGATVTTRKMQNGAALLNYNLCSDSSSCATNWGNTSGTDTVPGSGNGTQQTLTVYGVIPALQYPTPGAYSDTVVATVYY